MFNFKTTKCDADKTIIDDSKVMGNPMELVLGKKFKLEVWEVIVQKMALNEVACFRVDKSVCLLKYTNRQNEKLDSHLNSIYCFS